MLPLFKKVIIPENNDVVSNDKPVSLSYKDELGELYLGDSIKWLESIKKGSVDLVFADPPYNIKKAEWDSFKNQEEYIEWSTVWIKLASEILKPNGTLYICGFSEILADLKRPSMKYFKGCRWIVWHYKNKANMGSDWGRSHESILHFRKDKKFTFNIDDIRIPYSKHTLKYPHHPQSETSQYGNGKQHIWTPNANGSKPKDVIDLPTTCNGSGETTPHPTQKPEELVRKFLLASSNINDLVVDPFSGSGTTLVVAKQLGRKYAGCDNNPEYNGYAINRLQNTLTKPKEYWIGLDKKTLERRESMR
jgi:site-specific DNA-methyltransferase (adenine-specific)